MTDKKISALPNATTPLTGAEIVPIVQSGTTTEVSITNLTAGRSVTCSKMGAGVASPTLSMEVLGEAVYPTLGTASGGFKIGSSNGLYGLFGGVSGATGFSWLQAMRTDSATSYDIVLNPAGGNVQLGAGNLVQGTAAKGINFTANTPAAGMTSQLLNWYEEGTWTPVLAFGGASVGITYAAQAGTYTRTGRVVTGRFVIVLSSKGSSTGGCTITGLPFNVGADLGSAITELCSNFVSGAPTQGYCGNATNYIVPWAMATLGTGVVQTTDANFNNNTRLDMWFQYNI